MHWYGIHLVVFISTLHKDNVVKLKSFDTLYNTPFVLRFNHKFSH